MLLRVLLAVLFLAYPGLVYWAIQNGCVAEAAALLTLICIVRAAFKPSRLYIGLALVCALLSGGTFCLGSSVPVKLYPVCMNAAWLSAFALSLAGEKSALERFAELKYPDLPEKARHHCRQMTVLWCVFFIANGLVALDSALNRSDAWWGLYNGIIAYVLMGLLFAFEWCLRKWREQHH